MPEPIAWDVEARQLRAAGRTPRQVAKMLMRSVETVEEPLRAPRVRKPQGPKPIKAAGDREPRKRKGTDEKPSGREPLGAGRAGLAVPHAKRVVRVILDEQVLGSAVVAFAAGEIDRAELMRRISR